MSSARTAILIPHTQKVLLLCGTLCVASFLDGEALPINVTYCSPISDFIGHAEKLICM